MTTETSQGTREKILIPVALMSIGFLAFAAFAYIAFVTVRTQETATVANTNITQLTSNEATAAIDAPAIPAPTMALCKDADAQPAYPKTACAPGELSISAPTNITASGSYCLTNDINGSIIVKASNVNLDGHGYSIGSGSVNVGVPHTTPGAGSGIHVTDISVRNFVSTARWYVYGSQRVTIQHNRMASIYVVHDDTYSMTTVNGVKIYTCTTQVPPKDVTVDGNILVGSDYRDNLFQGTLCATGANPAPSTNFVIRNNIFVNNEASNPDEPMTLKLSNASDNLVTGNTIKSTAIAHSVRMRDYLTNNTIENNCIWSNRPRTAAGLTDTKFGALNVTDGDSLGALPSLNTFRNNFIRTDDGRGISVVGSGGSNTFENNVVWSNSSTGSLIEGTSSGASTADVFTHNTFYNTYNYAGDCATGSNCGAVVTDTLGCSGVGCAGGHPPLYLDFDHNVVVATGGLTAIGSDDAPSSGFASSNNIAYSPLGPAVAQATATVTDPKLPNALTGDFRVAPTSPACTIPTGDPTKTDYAGAFACTSATASSFSTSGHPVLFGSTVYNQNTIPTTWPNFLVIVRDSNGNPLPGRNVTLDFSAASTGSPSSNFSPIRLLDDQRPGGGTVDCVKKTITAIAPSDASGQVRFYPQFGGFANNPLVSVSVDGVNLGKVAARSSDIDGQGYTNSVDLALFLQRYNDKTPSGASIYHPEVDFNQDNAVSSVDMAILLGIRYTSPNYDAAHVQYCAS